MFFKYTFKILSILQMQIQLSKTSFYKG